MIRHADLAQARGADELKEAQAGLSISGALEIRVLLRQDPMPGVPDGAVALDIGVNEPVQVGGIPGIPTFVWGGRKKVGS